MNGHGKKSRCQQIRASGLWTFCNIMQTIPMDAGAVTYS